MNPRLKDLELAAYDELFRGDMDRHIITGLERDEAAVQQDKFWTY